MRKWISDISSIKYEPDLQVAYLSSIPSAIQIAAILDRIWKVPGITDQ
jgi:hypothetical protein